jgi:flagellar hook protein FlgE
MMRGMFAAISGLRNHQIALDVTANDIANVNTLGYKSARATFKDSLSQMQRGAAGATGNNGGANAAQVGLGVTLGSIDNAMQSGATQTTGNPLDVAIQNEGFFRVAYATPPAAPTAGIEYTRAGNLARNQAGYLTTQEGHYVLGRTAPFPGGADTLIGIPTDATGVAIAQDGSVSYIPAAGGARVVAGYLSLATFPNAAGLERTSGNRWIRSANSGDPNVATPGANGAGLVTAGAIEMSNVDLAQAFTNMITAQRGFQANSRIIGVSDEMLQELVNLKR